VHEAGGSASCSYAPARERERERSESPARVSRRFGVDLSQKHVIVVGGGVAGIAASVRLARDGVRVTLIEAKRRLGGRATSFTDAPTGAILDNCQHVVLGCCTRYLELCELLGVSHQLEWTKSQYWVECGGDSPGRISVLEPGGLPAPLHFAGSFLNAAFLTAAEKLAISACMARIKLADRDDWRGRTFGDFLRACGQPMGAVAKFWEPIIVSACNLASESVCAAPALKVFQDGFLASAQAANMGVPRVPLVSLYDETAQILTESGGHLKLGCSVAHVSPGEVTLASGERVGCDAVICALPMERACDIVADERLRPDQRLAAIRAGLAYSAIIGVHLVFDRQILEIPHAVLVGAATQWVFRKEGGRILAVISGAGELCDLPAEQLLDMVEADVRRAFPREARDAKRLWGRVVKERRATFAPTPEFERARTHVRPCDTGVVLAGDYTDTGWPATMEGAALSGFEAARLVAGLS